MDPYLTPQKSTLTEVISQCYHQPLEKLIWKAYKLRLSQFKKTIHFYAPGMIHYETGFFRAKTIAFPAISITGRNCQLNCEHCKGKLLEKMIPATTPQKLYSLCRKIKRKGAEGLLISGGSSRNGALPITKFIPTIRRIKRELGLKVAIHTGLVNKKTAEALAEAEVDAAMIDIIGSKETIREICHLKCGVEAYRDSLNHLREFNIPTVPHVVVGLHRGKLKGEGKALQMIRESNPKAVVIVSFTPLPQTPMSRSNPPTPKEIARTLLAARLLMPKTPIVLGCARPKGEHKVKTDILALKAGVNGIAYPSEEACSQAKKLGLKIRFHEECCSLIWREKLE